MKNAMSRALIETVVRKALEDLQDSPERSVRNLVDLALTFAGSRFQQYFFTTAQAMLKNEGSSYYKLISDMVASVDRNRLVTFGMNLGYNSCSMGAKTIRALEEEDGFNIPWAITLVIDGRTCSGRMDTYRSILQQGRELGIFTWQLHSLGSAENLLPLVEAFPDQAFILSCSPGEITNAMLDEAEPLHNLMFVVQYTAGVDDACHLLRSRRFLYSVLMTYGEADLETILSGELISDAEPLHPVFTAFLAAPDCPEAVRAQVYRAIIDARIRQIYKTVPWDVISDSRYVDRIISDDACSAGFDADGFLCTFQNRLTRQASNIFRQPLRDILREAFPKQAGKPSN